MTLEQILANPPKVDEAKLAATSEADIRRHMIEDGQDPDEEIGPVRLLDPGAPKGRAA